MEGSDSPYGEAGPSFSIITAEGNHHQRNILKTSLRMLYFSQEELACDRPSWLISTMNCLIEQKERVE
jgi:hypothetical protein